MSSTGDSTGAAPWHVAAAIGTTTMARINRLNHEHGLAERGAGALLIGLVVVTFMALAVGATVYDIGKWLAIW